MISVKEAVARAIHYLDELGELMPKSGLRLEETEFDDASGQWLITLSFGPNLFTNERTYKIFKVEADTGQIKSMKIRHLAV